MDYDDLLGLVRQRRSRRRFKTDPVPDELIEKIIEVARWAPSGANSQPWEFIVVKDKQKKDKIVEIIKEQGQPNHRLELARDEALRFPNIGGFGRTAGYKDAPVFIIMCGDPRTKQAYPLATEVVQGNSVFTSSLAGAFLYMALAATTLGLGCQWVTGSGSPLREPLLKQHLNIPCELKIYDMMAIGYPVSKPKPRLVRERADMVHVEGFDQARYRDDQKIREFVIDLRKRGGGPSGAQKA